MFTFQKRSAGVALAVVFVAAVAYTTVLSVPARSATDAEQHRRAEQACTHAVHARVREAKLPFAPRLTELEGARYRVEGVVDAPADGEMVRSNYGCIVAQTGAGPFRADSVWLWQSH